MDALKEMFNDEVVRNLGDRLAAVGPFDVDAFHRDVMIKLPQLEMKARSQHICEAMEKYLPSDYKTALKQVVSALSPARMEVEQVTEGLIFWPFCDFVETYGLQDPELSLEALRQITMRFSAEFAIRPFVIQHYELTMQSLEQWVKDENPHVRRLVSEGTRPRLPWGQRLRRFQADPSPVLALLERLKDDESLYVRRSVANNLNDIAKDHPDLVVTVSKAWWDEDNAHRKWLVKHALRSLIKAGDKGALSVLGFGEPSIEVLSLSLEEDVVQLGHGLSFNFEFRSTDNNPQRVIVDFAIHHLKANGTLKAKVFKGTSKELLPGEGLRFSRFHKMKPITTRRYYPGEHRLELLVNGQSQGLLSFELQVPE